MGFRDRHDAGCQLAALLSAELAGVELVSPLVLALPRGGVPVAYEVAKALDAPLDVFVVRKLGAPRQPELGVGAIAEGGARVVDEVAVRALEIADEDLDRVAERERVELERRVARYRAGRPLPPLAGRDLVLVDDGLATGVTARAAIAALASSGARSLVLAVPVAAADTVARLRAEGVSVVSVSTPTAFHAVGHWYDHFDQTADDEVLDLLARSARS